MLTQAPIFQLEQVGFQMNQQQILKEVSLTIHGGESIAIIGPSGSGKSTLLKIMGSLLSPTEGVIHYQGQNISEIAATEYRKEVSYFFQNAILFGETVRDNLAFPALIRDESFDEARAIRGLEKVSLDASYLDKSVHDLSGGEKQRIALVRNLMYLPKVLLMDEVTSSLDATNRDVILNYVRQLNAEESLTVLWITHNNDDTQYFDRVLQVKNGVMEELK
ncbi:ATP-binding cassette domain-containing protein [Aerococcaceae bacterium WS4759]|uniref:ATP-binding cassette domain-containing protein n=1 Tax=Fundicoccus ignavus TaxID=2664442 RepID=A0A6I2GQX3_9LACT|nr:ATP-binding cassette domain-containing protein [Fundicoccus ignavus]MRI85835.1 ATP-binding cassette domain-containing protein [Fundicoccus ignavus]